MKNSLKYEFTEKFYPLKSKVKLHQIRALKDIPLHGVKKGDLGGFVESEANLSQTGQSWVGDKAKVYDQGYVFGRAHIRGLARVYENAKVHGNVQLSENVLVYGNAEVYGNAKVIESSRVHGDAKVLGNAILRGTSHALGGAFVHGNAVLANHSHLLGELYGVAENRKRKPKEYGCSGLSKSTVSSEQSDDHKLWESLFEVELLSESL